MTHLVYPGALHTRFQHALGAMHLMTLALQTLRSKGVLISDQEEEASLAAILLHDIGHGPFSHSLEHTLVEGVSHELISALLMEKLNEEYDRRLDLAIMIFNNQYHRKFFHQLVSSQLDTDRMDYLNRDSFFTGVSEGVISFDRIIKMLHVKDNELVVEAKGIYSIEKFLIARRLMYWQVYLHKTVISAERMMIQALRRAKYLSNQGEKLFATEALSHFLNNRIDKVHFTIDSPHLGWFMKLDDTDIMSAIKSWATHSDFILSTLCSKIMRRDLFKTQMQAEPFEESAIREIKNQVQICFDLNDEEVSYFVHHQKIQNSTYDTENDIIKILNKNGTLSNIIEASDASSLDALSKTVVKYTLSYPKEIYSS